MDQGKDITQNNDPFRNRTKAGVAFWMFFYALLILIILTVYRNENLVFRVLFGLFMGIPILAMLSVLSVGITVEDRTFAIKVPWLKKRIYEITEKTRILHVENTKSCEYYPNARHFGASFGKFHSGLFSLNNGKQAYVAINSDPTFLLDFDGELVLFSCTNVDAFLERTGLTIKGYTK